MKNYFLVFLLAGFLSACGQAAPAQKQVPTATALAVPTPTAPAVGEVFGPVAPPSEDFVSLTSDNFVHEMERIIEGVSKFEPEIGSYLKNCEIGVANDSNYDLKKEGDGQTCLILFVPQELTHKPALQEYRKPQNPTAAFTVAAARDLFNDGYPFIFFSEFSLDLKSWVRVVAHEGFHMVQIKKGLDCSVNGEACTSLEEEVKAFQLEFRIMEAQYGPNPTLEDTKKPGGDDWYNRWVEAEYRYYTLNRHGLLLDDLQQSGYGGGD